jgi:hypothetical protein
MGESLYSGGLAVVRGELCGTWTEPVSSAQQGKAWPLLRPSILGKWLLF